MNTVVKYGLWGIGGLVYLGILVTLLYFTPIAATTFILLTVAFFVARWYNVKKKQVITIPEDILQDLHIAERRWEESGGKIEPHAILWEISKSKHAERFNESTSGRFQGERGIETAVVRGEPSERQHVQSYVAPTSTGHQSVNRRPQGNNRKRLFGRK